MSRVNRRYFLRLTGSTVAAFSLAPLIRFAGAQDATAGSDAPAEGAAAGDASELPQVRAGKTLVMVFLRGGMDGLNFVVPYGDPAYAGLRPGIGIAAPTRNGNGTQALDLDGYFGLHPAARALHDLHQQGQVRFLHAVGNPQNNRSHFTQQDQWETLDVSGNASNDAAGWLNRHLQSTRGHGTLRAVAISGSLPRALRGDASASAIERVQDLAYNNRYGDNESIEEQLRRLYEEEQRRRAAEANGESGEAAGAEEDVERAAGETLEGLQTLEEIARETYTPAEGANYPNDGFATKLKEAAHLIKSGIGLEVVQVDVNGWDTHRNQGNEGGGPFADRITRVSESIAAFLRDLGDKREDVCVVTLSEFGRTARENGTGGTDHGHGSTMFVAGGPLMNTADPLPVLGDWPGLAPEQLRRNRELAHTTDFRDVLVEVMARHLGNTNHQVLAPGFTPSEIGLLPRG